jgi:hypothetical protein
MTDPAPRPPRRFRLGPRAVSAIALTVLGACAATIVALPAPPESLRALSNWQLAELLPAADDFPPDWNYGLAGVVHRSAPDHTPGAAPAPARNYVPPSCSPDPAIAELDSGIGDARVYVDRNTDEIARAHLLGEENPDPHAEIVIWAVPDGPARIAKYVDWLHKCGRYNINSLDPLHHTPRTNAVTATVNSHPVDGDDVSLAFTRSSTPTAPKAGSAIVTHVTYYWVRGVLLECSTNLSGAGGDVVNHVVAQTLQKLRAA